MIEARIDEKEVLAMLGRLRRKVDDLTPAMRAISADMLDAVHENFDQEGRPRWSRSRRAILTGGQTLQDSRRLYRSITNRWSASRAIVGTNVIYAAIHHFGGQAGRGRKTTIPARPYLTLQDSDRRRLLETMRRYLGTATG